MCVSWELLLAGQDAAFEAQLSCLFDAGFGLGDSANFSGQAHFAEKDRPRIDDFFLVTRSDRRDNAEVHGGFIHVDTAGDVDEDILVEEPDAHFFLQDRYE